VPIPNERARFWDDLAERYAAKPVEDPAAFERKIALNIELLSPRSRVLEIGCGTGSLALRLASHAAELHCFDISEEMLRIARGKAEQAGDDRIRFHHGTLEDVPRLAPGPYDCVHAYSILHLLPDPANALCELLSLLRPGGHLVSSTAVLGDSPIPYRPILALMRWLGKAPPVCVMKHAELDRWVAGAGFEQIRRPDVGAGDDVAFIIARRPD
jgi:2-polyprenyl-3-methyl-5-hydroxy-6-metoxy-1,4-benzoquinol methylase